jgi:hypothetical protein
LGVRIVCVTLYSDSVGKWARGERSKKARESKKEEEGDPNARELI